MRHIIIGVIILAVGAAITLGSLALSQDSEVSLVAYIVIGWGALQVLFGAGQLIFNELRPLAVKAKDQAETEKFAFIHSMIAMAAADGKIEDTEIKRVMELFQKVMNFSVAESDVRRVAEQYKQGTRSWKEAIDFNAKKMTAERRATLFKACVMVACADGEIADKERARIDELAHHVGIAKDDEERVMRETLALLKTDAVAATA